MIEMIVSLLTALNALTPLAIVGLLAVIIFMLVRQKSQTDNKLVSISDNHLSGLPEMSEALHRIEITLEKLDAYLRARLNHVDKE